MVIETRPQPVLLSPPDQLEDLESASASATECTLTVIVPTRNEAGNVNELVRQLNAVCVETPVEILFVDDSEDETPDRIRQAVEWSALPVRLLHRKKAERVGGLGGAVLAGLAAARGPYACVMDGDLQHPPAMVPRMLAKAIDEGADVVVGSRYNGEGDASSFNKVRALVSEGSTTAARAMFPRRLRDVTDPMSGLFLVRREALRLETYQPRGFKILLEILCRTPNLRCAEVPFAFGTRFAGESKASLREGVRFLQLLLALRMGSKGTRFVRFGLVGISGLLVNSMLLFVLAETFALFYLAAAVLATQGSTTWNFLLAERWVFGRKSAPAGKGQRFLKFLAMNNFALLLRGPMLFGMVSLLGFHYLFSNLFTLVALMVLRFATADRLIWSGVGVESPKLPQHVAGFVVPANSSSFTEGVQS